MYQESLSNRFHFSFSFSSAPYAHHQMGSIERCHRTVYNRTRAVLKANKLPKNLWAEISSAIVYLKNRSPTSALQGRTPYEVMHGKLPSLHRLRALGCVAYAHRHKEIRKGNSAEEGNERPKTQTAVQAETLFALTLFESASAERSLAATP